MPIRVTHVNLAQAPWHVGRRPRDFEFLRQAILIDRVHIIHQDTQPRTLVGGLVAFRAEGHFGGAFATSPLPVLAEKDRAFRGADSSEVRWIAPVPCFLPPELLEPLKLSRILETFKMGVSRLACMAAIPFPRMGVVQGSEVRGQRSQVTGQRSQVTGQRSEVKGQRSEVRGHKSEVRCRRSEVRGQRSEVRGRRSEVRSRRCIEPAERGTAFDNSNIDSTKKSEATYRTSEACIKTAFKVCYLSANTLGG